MTQWLEQIQPDVVLFQEVTFEEVSRKQLMETMKAAGFRYISLGWTHPPFQGRKEKDFYGQCTASKIPFVGNPHSIYLEKDPLQKLGRNALCVTLTNGLTVINTHLDCFDRTGETRLKQVNQIFDWINSKTRKNNTFILAGDFNTERRKNYSDSTWERLQKEYIIETETLDFIEQKMEGKKCV